MKPGNQLLGILLFPLLAIPAIPGKLASQGLWGTVSAERGFSLEIAKPFFDGDGVSFATTTTFLSVTWPFSDRLRFVGEFPLSYASFDNEYEDESDSDLAVGNPYLGVSIGEEDSRLTGQVGLRLPLVTDFEDLGEAEWIGMAVHTVDRMGAFWPKVLPILGTATYTHRQENGFVALLTGGFSAWVSFEDETGVDDVEAVGLYGGRVGYDGPEWMVLGGIVGRGILTEDHATLASATEHEAGVQVSYQGASVQPTAFIRLPLDEDRREFLDVVAGLSLRIIL
jgi:hypothetical protein